jgi:predicted TIM-barrel fold metal-dependent hydrolase
MKKSWIFVLIAVCGVWVFLVEKRLATMPDPPFEPPLDPYAAGRETADSGFSKGYGFYMSPYCYFWSDAHTHTCSADLSQEDRNRELILLHNVMYELDIVNSAVFCKTEEDLAFVHSLGRHAPVWYVDYNDPDIEKLREYHERYRIRAIKKHNTPVLYGEFRGETIEFPKGTGKSVPVTIDLIISDEWMEFYAECERLGLPITWHTNNRYGPSPYNFGGDNSRCWDGLPYDNFYVLGLIEKILETYPKLDIILCHQGFMGYPLLDGLFEKHPNLYIDTSAGYILQAGDYLTDSERARIRPFFIKWSDRILFGSDANTIWEGLDQVSEHKIRRHVYNLVNPSKRFINNLFLPQPALSKVAHQNFERLFDMAPAGDWFF